MPYLRPNSTDQRSTPIGSNILVVSVQVNDARLERARKIAGAKLLRASVAYSSHHPAGTPLCRKADLPSWAAPRLLALIGNRAAPRTFNGRLVVDTVWRPSSTSLELSKSPTLLVKSISLALRSTSRPCGAVLTAD